ncbi:hypothetical protein [Streptomyces chattanoogensis]|uniref:hypothetical protein n=1 Tax=Streptomyces chattanoogensis TaxID=66876 RepID=UPI00369AD7EF
MRIEEAFDLEEEIAEDPDVVSEVGGQAVRLRGSRCRETPPYSVPPQVYRSPWISVIRCVPELCSLPREAETGCAVIDSAPNAEGAPARP